MEKYDDIYDVSVDDVDRVNNHTCTPHQIHNSPQLQIVNDLEETYRPRYKFEFISPNGSFRAARHVADRLGNHFVTLEVTPNLQGKIRVDWLTISNTTGQRYVMPYDFQASNEPVTTFDFNPIMHDISTDNRGFMRLYVVLIKARMTELEQSQPLVPFQPVIDVLHNSSISCHRQMSGKELIRKFQLNKSQLAFTLCTTTDGKSFIPQWHTTVFSTVMTEITFISRNWIISPTHHHMLSSNANTHDDHEQNLSMFEDAMKRSKRQKLDDTRREV
ncbi:unnamed protein product [Adineta steineri]|uniref:Uncharacterized protein n=1 Tax=Adineta steineri TaxID=433720 RepID=A0A819VPN9_9BILA|nr:unnamed protein product [Adineta steineri]